MRAFLKFASWPALAGLLAALLILEYWVWPRGASFQGAPTSSYRSAVAAATPAVVNIYTAKLVNPRRSLLDNLLFPLPRGVPRQRVAQSLGSGVIMSQDGYILTNNHLIQGDPENIQIQVLLSDGRSAAATVVGRDEETDLAALRIELDGLTAIELADSNRIAVGDVVLAIGNPLGFGHSVTQGIISGLGRFGLQLGTYEGFIQTDAVIHPGNSGGALVNDRGELVGINTLIFTAPGNANANTQSANVGIGIALAIPSRLAQFVMDDLIRFGQVIRGWLGVSVEQFERSGGTVLHVRAVATDGPADRAGLRPADLITRIDGQPIDDVRLTMLEVALLRPGEKLAMTVEREGSSLDLQAVVGAQPDPEGG